MLGKFSGAALIFLIPLAGNAAEIKQRPFGFSDEVTRTQETDAFVVCSNCPDGHLSLLPSPPKLALRWSSGESQSVQTLAKESEAKPKPNLEKRGVSCLLGAIHFRFDSAVLTQRERSRLDEFIRAIPPGSVANLAGYTCDLGTTSHNMGLSLRRAKGVASYLKEKGISVGHVEGMGECCPVSGDRHLNRRVEVTTHKEEGN